MAKNKRFALESVLDLNTSNIWDVDENEVARLWEQDRKDSDFALSEEKVINMLRTGFEVAHFNPDDEREAARYPEEEWAILDRSDPRRGCAAIRRKHIRTLADLTYENVKHVTAPMLLELIARNFGGGWDSIPLSIKDIIESAFDVSTSCLPSSRIHAKGGTLDRKVKQGFEVLEVAKGTWTEAIFAKKKEMAEKVRLVVEEKKYDEDGNPLPPEEEENKDIEVHDEDEGIDDSNLQPQELDEEEYSCYSAEAEVKPDDEEEDAASQPDDL